MKIRIYHNPTKKTEEGKTSVTSNRVFRGGSWIDDPSDLRVSLRLRNEPTDRYNDLGFRIVKNKA